MNFYDLVRFTNLNATSTITNVSPLGRIRIRPKYNLRVKGIPSVVAVGPVDIVRFMKTNSQLNWILPKWDLKYLFQDGKEEPRLKDEAFFTDSDKEELEKDEVLDPVIEHDSLIAYVIKQAGVKR